jgi:outer membrane protein assembly factor BamA
MIAGLTYDTIQGRYLEATQGQSVHLFYQESRPLLGGDRQYRSGGIQGVNYTRLPRESTLASRLFYGRSVGADSQVFRLGGFDRIRGLSQENLSNKKTNVLLGGLEMRYRLAYLNARTKFLFPDFFFKAAYLLMFDDIGYGWDNSTERDGLSLGHANNSAGMGIMWPTFIMQTFRLDFSIQWAHVTNTGANVWYISVGPSF